MKILAAAAATAIALAGCQSVPDMDAGIRRSLPKICAGAEVAHQGFLISAETGRIKSVLVKREAAAYASLRNVCDRGDQVTSAEVLLAATRAAVAIATYVEQAEDSGA